MDGNNFRHLMKYIHESSTKSNQQNPIKDIISPKGRADVILYGNRGREQTAFLKPWTHLDDHIFRIFWILYLYFIFLLMIVRSIWI